MEFREPFLTLIDSRNKSVTQCNKNGKELKTFKSVSEASKQTGVNKTSIGKVCRGERNIAGGFIWKY